MEDAKAMVEMPDPQDFETVTLSKAEYEEARHAFDDLKWFASQVLDIPMREVSSSKLWAFVKSRGGPSSTEATYKSASPATPPPTSAPPPSGASTPANGAQGVQSAHLPKTESHNGL